MLWFKNAIWYKFSPPENFSGERLLDALEQKPFVPCRGAEAKSQGFISPASGLIEAPLFTSNGFHLISLLQEEKILPASVIKDAVNDKVAEIESNEDRKVFRKEQQQLKEEITLSLLPRAFSRRRVTRALIAPAQQLIVVETSSYNRADELLNLLREALGSLQVTLPTTKQAPNRVMTDWVLDQRALPDSFVLGGETEMKDPLESGMQIRFKGHELSQSEVQAHLQGGLLVDRVALTWQEQLEFMLHSDLSIKRLKLTEQYQEQHNDEAPEDQLQALDTDLAHLGLELCALIPALSDAFGGAAD